MTLTLNGRSVVSTLTVINLDSPDRPTDIVVAGGSVPENALAGAVVATLSTVDPSPGDTFTYQLNDTLQFVIVGNEIHVAANAGLDAAQASPQLQVMTIDAGGHRFFEDITIHVTAADNPPSGVTLTPVVTQLAESASTARHVKVADVGVADDGAGANVLSLSGADARFFEIVGTGLFLKAGVHLDFETKPAYNVTVDVNDPAVGSAPDASAVFHLPIRNAGRA